MRTGRGTKTLPSARRVALGKDSNFTERQAGSTRRSFELCRVLPHWHSAKFGSLPSATRLALGKARNFAECCQLGTRRSLNLCLVPHVWHSAKFSTPSRSAVPFVLFARSIRQFACSSVPFQLFLPSAAWHTAKVYRVPEKRHSAKPAPRSCRLFFGLCRVSVTLGKVRESGSAWWQNMVLF